MSREPGELLGVGNPTHLVSEVLSVQKMGVLLVLLFIYSMYLLSCVFCKCFLLVTLFILLMFFKQQKCF